MVVRFSITLNPNDEKKKDHMEVWFGHVDQVCHSVQMSHACGSQVLLVGRHFVSSIENGARKVPEAEAKFVKSQTGGR